ncbi:FUSC family protein [Jatrophihabitans sp.]|uniref:FUSC family protein n=1 Tax=Jatrophihabitans sp. TaxID=1932789 RepID=UPI0030C6E891
MQLRATAVTLFGVLASFGTAWLIESLAGLHTDVVVLAVVLSLTLSRRVGHGRAWYVSVPLLIVVAVAAGLVGTLMLEHVALGDTLFTLALAAGIWLRRFGPWGRRAGTLVALPFIAILVTPAPPGISTEHSLWTAAFSAIALGWVLISQYLGRRLGLLAPETPAAVYEPPARRSPTGRIARIPASSKMAAQMGVGLGLAFLLGHQVFPQHWPWVVLTAYIVASGNRGRGDVVYKSGLRLVGAAVGTVLATLLANSFTPGNRWAIVALFVVVGIAAWLRTWSYAFWAAGVTSALALLYGYSGQTGTSLLGTRLEAIGCGAALAIAAAWFVLPIKTSQVLRRRVADALAVFSDLLTAIRRRDTPAIDDQQQRLDAALIQAEQLRPALHAHRLATQPFRAAAHQVDAITGLRTLGRSSRAITTRITERPELTAAPGMAGELAALHAALTATRRRLGHAEVDEPSPPPLAAADLPEAAELHAALRSIAAAFN